jgi:hypothetical protein
VQIDVARVIRRNQVWTRCSAIDNGRTDVDKQRSGSPSTSPTEGKVCCADALIREDRNINKADTARMLGFSPCSEHSIVRDKRDYRSVCAQAECQSTSRTITKFIVWFSLPLMHLTRSADQAEEVSAVY